MSSAAISARLTAIRETPRILFGELSTVDHKKIGMRYIVTSIAFLPIGGVEALMMRIQLAGSQMQRMQPGGPAQAPEALIMQTIARGLTPEQPNAVSNYYALTQPPANIQ